MKKYDNEKIKAMSDEERMAWIKAIDEVVLTYKNNDNSNKCSLCETGKIYNNLPCLSCPWLRFEGIDCLDFAEKLFNKRSIPFRSQYDSGETYYGSETTRISWNKWKRIRYPMLRRWKKILKEDS